MTITHAPPVDEGALEEFLGRVVADLGATVSAALVVIGDRLGLYAALADGAPLTAEELAARTGCAAVYVRPWLANQAAGGYVRHDAASGTWSMAPEQVAVLADPDSPAFFPGSMQLAVGVLRDTEAVAEL